MFWGKSKKLEACARAMVRGVPKPDLEMFARLGIKADMQAHFTEKIETHQPVHPENWQAITVFLAVQTQWRVMADQFSIRYLGLDYAALSSTIAMMGVGKKQRSGLFDDIRVLEAAWLIEHAQLQQGRS
jgi:hypothetical protein